LQGVGKRLRGRNAADDGTDFIGYYGDWWWGWVDYHNPLPRIRGDIRFV
jgi:hypothetical protein